MVIGLVVDRGAKPTALADAGALVRWGLPVTTVVAELAAAATIGLLGLAVFVVPEGGSTSRRIRLARSASVAALVWVVAGVVQLLLAFSDVSGTPVLAAGYFGQLMTFVWSIELTRVLFVSVGWAMLAGLGASAARGRPAMTWSLLSAFAGIGILALNGHAAGTATHEDAVDTMGVHLVAMACWVGGLLALALSRRALGHDFGVAVRRYSVVALWSFVAMGVSGVIQAAIRLGSWSGLVTAYGALVIVKAVVLAVLGWFGWQHRRNLATRLTKDPGDGRGFARLAVGELAVMGVGVGIAVALSRGIPPAADAGGGGRIQALTGYPDPGPLTFARWLTAWRFDALFLGVAIVAVGLYLAGVHRLHRRGDAWPVGRAVSWVGGWAVWVYATCGAPGIWGRVLFSTHMVMHMAIAMIVPLFLVPAAPVTLVLRALPPRRDGTWGPRELLFHAVHSRAVHILGNPVIAALFFFVSLAVFYYSPLFGLALTTHTGHLLMLAHFLLTGYLFTWVLIGIDPGPPKWSPLFLLVILFATISFHAFFGVIITSDPKLLAPDFFGALHLPWMTDVHGDQVNAGEIAWGVGEVPTLALALMVARSWVRRDRAEQVRLDRQADRDHDADLTAYNEMLAGLRAQDDRLGR